MTLFSGHTKVPYIPCPMCGLYRTELHVYLISAPKYEERIKNLQSREKERLHPLSDMHK